MVLKRMSVRDPHPSSLSSNLLQRAQDRQKDLTDEDESNGSIVMEREFVPADYDS